MGQPRWRVFISSPGDVAEERVVANNLVRRLADEYAEYLHVEPVFWEHEPLLATETFQKQIPPPHDCDVWVCILWSRLGTRLPASLTRADGSRYASGTEYEFEDALSGFRQNGHPQPLVYFKTADPVVSLRDAKLEERIAQKNALDAFYRKWFIDETEGTATLASHRFKTTAEFEELLEHHLRKLLDARVAAIGKELEVKSAWTKGSPFRGLDVFQIDDAPIFFGRTSAISDVLIALRSNAADGRGFALITGVSGGGKSSLVRAGVLPLLLQPGVIEGVALWRHAILKPSDSEGHPLRALASALFSAGALPEVGADGTTAQQLSDLLEQNPTAAFALVKGGLSQAAAAMAAREKLPAQPNARLVVVIDQLEELFTLPRITQTQREQFIAAISALARSGRVWVIATLRGDFYHRIFDLPELVALQDGAGHYALRLPTTPEFAQMIRQPARMAGLRFEVDPTTHVSLDETLLADAGTSRESLPLLAFTLQELYESKADDGLLTYEAYRRLGGVEGALRERAESVFNALPSAVQETMPSVMRAMVTITGDAIAAQNAPLAYFAANPNAKAFIDAFVHARLFSADQGESGEAVVRVTHEALLRVWPRAQKWLQQDRELLSIRSRIRGAAERWAAQGRASDLLLGEGKPLAEGEILENALGPELREVERQFIDASKARRAARRRLRRAALAALVCLTAVALVAAIYARHQRDVAELARKGEATEAAHAIAQKNEAQRNLAQFYVLRGQQAHRGGDPSLGLLWYVRALQTAPDDAEQQTELRRRINITRRELPQLLKVYSQDESPRASDGFIGMIDTYVPSSEIGGRSVGSHSRTRSEQGERVIMVDGPDGKPLKQRFVHPSDVVSTAISNSGELLATSADDQRVYIWEIDTGKLRGEPHAFPGRVRVEAIAPNGLAVCLTINGSASLWNPKTWEKISDLAGVDDRNFHSAVFSHDSTLLLTLDATQVFRVSNGKPHSHPIAFKADQGMFNPTDDAVLLWNDNAACVYDFNSDEYTIASIYGTGSIDEAGFAADGDCVFIKSVDRYVQKWGPSITRSSAVPFSGRRYVSSADLSPDEQRFLVLTDIGTVRVWDRQSGQPLSMPIKVDKGRRVSFDARVWFLSDNPPRAAAQCDQSLTLVDLARQKPIKLWNDELERSLDKVLSFDESLWPQRTRTGSVIWDLKRQQQASKLIPWAKVESTNEEEDPVLAITEKWQVRSGGMDRVAIIDNATGARAATLNIKPEKGHGHVERAAFNGDATLLLVATAHGECSVWDTRTWERLWRHDYNDMEMGGRFNAGGEIVVMVGLSGARACRARTGEQLAFCDTGEVESYDISPNGDQLLTCSYDKPCRLWNLRSGKLAALIPDTSTEVDGARFGASGKRILWYSDGAVGIVDISSDPTPAADLMAYAELVAGRKIDSGDAVIELDETEMLVHWKQFASSVRPVQVGVQSIRPALPQFESSVGQAIDLMRRDGGTDQGIAGSLLDWAEHDFGMGLISEATIEADRASKLDPASSRAAVMLAASAIAHGQMDRALAIMETQLQSAAKGTWDSGGFEQQLMSFLHTKMPPRFFPQPKLREIYATLSRAARSATTRATTSTRPATQSSQ
jgi:WD40 repeat protein